MKYLRQSFESPRQGWDASPSVNAPLIYRGFLRMRQGGTTFQLGSDFGHAARNSSYAVYHVRVNDY